MESDYTIIDNKKYELYDDLGNGIFKYKAIIPSDDSSRDNHNYFFAKRLLRSEDLHIGEHLGGMIGKELNFKVCDTSLYRHILNYYDRGVISYVHLSKNDKIFNPNIIIFKYLETQNINQSYIQSIDIDTVMKAMFWFMYQYRRPYNEFLDFKQDFIDMIVYDLKLLNPDRRLDNWLIRQDFKTRVIDLYPMFDNEMILGFGLGDVNSYFSDEEIANQNYEITLPFLVPNSKSKKEANYIELFKYILKNYPIQTQNSLNKFKFFSVERLSKILGLFPELSEYRKNTIVRLYDKRSFELDKIYEQFKNELQRD